MSVYSHISIVVATWNRRQTLERTLSHLQNQSLSADRFELIVVDDGSTDGTGEMIAAIQPQLEFPVRYFWHPNRGPGYSQNVGIQNAKHDLILLLADDIWPTPGMLAAHLKSHERQPQCHIAVLGDVVPSPDLPHTAIHRVWDPFQYGRFRGNVNWMASISMRATFPLRRHSCWLMDCSKNAKLRPTRTSNWDIDYRGRDCGSFLRRRRWHITITQKHLKGFAAAPTSAAITSIY